MGKLTFLKRLLGKEDVLFGTGSTTFTTSRGETRTLTEINASHIPLSGGGSLEGKLNYLEDRIEQTVTEKPLSSNVTIDCANKSVAQIKEELTAIGTKNLNGKTLYLVFPAGVTTTFTETLTITGFYNGYIDIRSTKVTDPTETATLRMSVSVAQIINFQNCTTANYIRYIRFDMSSNVTTRAIYAHNSNVRMTGCVFAGNSAASVYAVTCSLCDAEFSSGTFTSLNKRVNITDGEVNQLKDDVNASLATKANLASPTLTGTPKAPTADAGTSNTQIATTAFVKNTVKNTGIGGAIFASSSSKTFTLDESTKVVILGNINIQWDDKNGNVGLYVDNTCVQTIYQGDWIYEGGKGGAPDNCTFGYSTTLSAGSHTVKMKQKDTDRDVLHAWLLIFKGV